MSIGFKGVVGLGIVLVFYVIGLSAAQVDVSQAKITEADLAPGYPWELMPSGAWEADFYTTDKITQCTSVDADCRGDGWLKTADEFRAWAMTTSFVKDSAQPYDALPGGVISIVSSGSDEGSGGYFSTTYCILFWKSPQCWGFVTTDAGASCSEKCRAEHEAMCAFARSECERLAKIVYDRLPTGDEAMLRAQDDIETAKTIRDNTKPSEEEKAAYVCRSAGISCPGLEENPGLFDIEEIDSYPDKERDYTHWSHVVEKMETEFRQKHYVEVHNIFMTGYEEYAEYY